MCNDRFCSWGVCIQPSLVYWYMYYVVVTTINYDFVVPDVSDLQRQRNIEICDG